MIARLVETLKAAGALENTYLFFTSDNGFHLGQHRMLMGKQTAYEEDIRVPLIVRGPGVPSGRTIDRLVVETDLAPTFAELAGTKPADFVDGRSLVPLLGANLPAAWRQGVLIEHYTGDEPGLTEFEETQLVGRRRIPDYFALRTPEWTYVEYKTGERELYDVIHDPDALHNQIAKADRQVVQRLAARLAALRSCRTDACRDAEDRVAYDAVLRGGRIAVGTAEVR